MPDIILLNELSDQLDELRSDLDVIDSNINTIKTTVESILTNTEVNNIENPTGTLSQKLTSIYNILNGRIGLTNDTGGSSTAGTLMSKLNALLSKKYAAVVTGTVQSEYDSYTDETTLTLPGGYYYIVCSVDSDSGAKVVPSGRLSRWTYKWMEAGTRSYFYIGFKSN